MEEESAKRDGIVFCFGRDGSVLGEEGIEWEDAFFSDLLLDARGGVGHYYEIT